MIVLDTNVVSEPLRPKPDENVIAWLDRQSPETLFLTAINVSELLSGVQVLPLGKRKERLTTAVNGLIAEFGNRVLAFDRFCAQTHAMVYADLLSAGKRVDFSDSSIAAIARHHNFAIATRNLKHFEGAGVTLINPWVE